MSPIKGVSEIVRLPRLGKIKLGIRKDAGEGCVCPLHTDYFVCPEEVKKVFGEKPTELRIMFPTEDESHWASQYLKCYSESGNLICCGDGETAIACVNTLTGEMVTGETADTRLRKVNCLPDMCVYYQQRQCRRVMNLQFLLTDCPGFGVYQLDTRSYHSIVNINSMLTMMRGTCQRLSMIPLSLRLVPKEVLHEGEWKEIYVLKLSTPFSLIEMQAYVRIPPGRVLLVPLSDNEAPEDLSPNKAPFGQESLDSTPYADNELLQMWNKAKSMIRGLDICEIQISNWFQRHYRLKVGLIDFDGEIPPEKLTIERLRCFCEAVECHGSCS